MNLDKAPGFFWAALSVSLLMLTGGMLLLAYRASSMSVQFGDKKIEFAKQVEKLAQSKIEVSSIVADTKGQLEDLLRQNQNLQAVNAELQNRIARLKSAAAGGSVPAVSERELADLSSRLSNLNAKMPADEKLAADLKRLNTIQKDLINPAQQQAMPNR